jgi:hypothetical protein
MLLYRNWAAVRSFRRTRTDLQLGVMSRFGVFTLVAGFAAVCVLVMLRIPRFLLDRRITHRLGAVVLPNNWQGGAVWNIFIVTGKQFVYSVSASANIYICQYPYWRPWHLVHGA